MKNFIFFSLCLLGLAMSGCYWDNEEYLYPKLDNKSCDTLQTPSYSKQVLPMLQNSCLGCHNDKSAASIGGNLSLEGYDNAKRFATNGRLLGTIRHATGFSPMPKGASKIDDCTIRQVKRWIDSGAANN